MSMFITSGRSTKDNKYKDVNTIENSNQKGGIIDKLYST